MWRLSIIIIFLKLKLIVLNDAKSKLFAFYELKFIFMYKFLDNLISMLIEI